jgi:hypothetical protein
MRKGIRFLVKMSPAHVSEHLYEDPWRPECVICKQAVTLEESKADEYGQAIHGECYFAKITEKKPPLLSLC